jgi:hypothetical protein
MWVPIPVRVAITRANAHPTNLEHRNAERGIDITGAAAAKVEIIGLREQPIEPQIVIEPNANK